MVSPTCAPASLGTTPAPHCRAHCPAPTQATVLSPAPGTAPPQAASAPEPPAASPVPLGSGLGRTHRRELTAAAQPGAFLGSQTLLCPVGSFAELLSILGQSSLCTCGLHFSLGTEVTVPPCCLPHQGSGGPSGAGAGIPCRPWLGPTASPPSSAGPGPGAKGASGGLSGHVHPLLPTVIGALGWFCLPAPPRPLRLLTARRGLALSSLS